jgi:phosphate transport system substrate-binding protein
MKRSIGSLLGLASLVLVTTLLVAACTPPGTVSTSSTPTGVKGSIVVKGSDTMVNLASSWAEAYQLKHPETRITVSGGGSGIGIASLLNKTTDICDNSRPLSQKELDQAKASGIDPISAVVAQDAVSVVVNPANSLKEISMDQLAAIFSGKITNWKEIGGADGEIVVLSRDNNSGTYTFFKEHVLQAKDKKAEYGAKVQFLPTSQAIADEVARSPMAIGYLGLGYTSDATQTLAIRGTTGKPVLPSKETVLDGTYSLSRPLYCTTNGQPFGAVKAYMDWILGPEGQQIVSSLDFVPVK